jgi:hypothetical protein
MHETLSQKQTNKIHRPVSRRTQYLWLNHRPCICHSEVYTGFRSPLVGVVTGTYVEMSD